MKKSFGLGKKNLYLGFAFLVVVGLLSFFIFSGVREGFYGYVDGETTDNTSGTSGTSTSGTSGTATASTAAAAAAAASTAAGATAVTKKCIPKDITNKTTSCSSITSPSSCASNSDCKWV